MCANIVGLWGRSWQQQRRTFFFTKHNPKLNPKKTSGNFFWIGKKKGGIELNFLCCSLTGISSLCSIKKGRIRGITNLIFEGRFPSPTVFGKEWKSILEKTVFRGKKKPGQKKWGNTILIQYYYVSFSFSFRIWIKYFNFFTQLYFNLIIVKIFISIFYVLYPECVCVCWSWE